MKETARLGVLLAAVAAFTFGVMLSVEAPSVAVVSGLFGALVPVAVIYGVMVS